MEINIKTEPGEINELLAALSLILAANSTLSPGVLDDLLEATEGEDFVPEEPPLSKGDKEAFHAGEEAWRKFVLDWAQGFGDPNAAQPDRGDLMVTMMREGGNDIIGFIKAMGGLTRSILSVTKEANWDRRFSRLIAENITQVGSIICPPLAEHLEYPWKFDTL